MGIKFIKDCNRENCFLKGKAIGLISKKRGVLAPRFFIKIFFSGIFDQPKVKFIIIFQARSIKNLIV